MTCRRSVQYLRSWVGLVTAAVFLLSCGDSTEVPAPGEERPQADEAQITASMIDAITAISLARYPDGTLRRFNQAKSLACLDATFTVDEGLPANLRHGLFAEPKAYPARLRVASATEWDDREKDFRGLSIKVSGVGGEPLWGEAGQQDFLLNSYPALFAGTPKDFLAFIEASGEGALWRYVLHPAHWYSLPILLRGREAIDNPLAIRYWSTTPYRLGGDSSAVKYSVQPCAGTAIDYEGERDEGFLAQAIAVQLAEGSACLEFMVQVQGDPASMPIEDAAVIWDEKRAPFQRVALIEIPDQNFQTSAQLEACETVAFNPWQSLAAHRPLGGINRVRKAVYAELARFRGQANAER